MYGHGSKGRRVTSVRSVAVGLVETYRGGVDAGDLGITLMHEHIFVRNPELELNLHDSEWDEPVAVRTAIAGLTDLYDQGVRTVVDLTVPGLGRDALLVSRVAERVPVNLVAATGWYTSNVLPLYFRFHGPGLLIDGADPLVNLFIGDIRDGIAGGRVKAAMLKVMTDIEGMTPDVERVMSAAATAHCETGVTVATHSHPASRNGLQQQAFLEARGVSPDRIVVGHSGDSEDLDYLQRIMDSGSTIGVDRFGMEHVLPDEVRVRTLISLLERGYADRIVLSHDAAFYSHVTPPSWRAREAPDWRMDKLFRKIVPMLRDGGVSSSTIEQMVVANPQRLLEKVA
jgi:phosphotriesterase-related protein